MIILQFIVFFDDISAESVIYSQGKNIRFHHPGNPLGMYWKRIKPSQLAGFNTFPSAYPIDSQVVGMYVFCAVISTTQQLISYIKSRPWPNLNGPIICEQLLV